MFAEHTPETAPATARRLMEATTAKLGYLPSAVARMATSPHALEAFLKTSAMFEQTTLDPLAREVLIMTVATRNGCHLCVAMHTAKLVGLNADRSLITALREGKPLDDERLEAVRTFTTEVLDTAGAVSPEALERFVARGFTAQNALEVVMGIGVYTLSTFANRLTDAPIDPPLASFA
ncbi:carboxymuconolactone decarboxylase family protein [Saccharothrix sp. NPDC042600]|uniref:carboxymuconolactone decarboxylase family protein n=1 Tax=Saccharothrix TaxID=2071 RepID=UPI0033DFC19C|nr:carboxymuconolactone decarboxylase family protein [Saccharothrix mutabilis subsp. capreolus]